MMIVIIIIIHSINIHKFWKKIEESSETAAWIYRKEKFLI